MSIRTFRILTMGLVGIASVSYSVAKIPATLMVKVDSDLKLLPSFTHEIWGTGRICEVLLKILDNVGQICSTAAADSEGIIKKELIGHYLSIEKKRLSELAQAEWLDIPGLPNSPHSNVSRKRRISSHSLGSKTEAVEALQGLSVEQLKEQIFLSAKHLMLDTKIDFFEIIYSRGYIIKPLIQAALATTNNAVDEEESLLNKFFTIQPNQVDNFFYDSIKTYVQLRRVCFEYFIFCRELWGALSPEVKIKHKEWRLKTFPQHQDGQAE